ncbi:hypothetical protein MMC30_009149 [Trapelia coarctata]|nr:hypothetical protein [Trapelia coarctata]
MVGCDLRDQDENRLLVVLSTSAIPAVLRGSGGRNQRQGVRIPLDDLEQCVTLWPGGSKDRARSQRLFADGALAAQGIRFTLCADTPLRGEAPDISYAVEDTSGKPQKKNHKINPITRSIITAFLLVSNPPAVKAITRLTASWPTEARDAIAKWLLSARCESSLGPMMDPVLNGCLAQLEIFILGYYYAVLSSLVDASQLHVQEAYGAWGWNDLQILNATREFVHSSVDKSKPYPRHQVLKLAGYFYAGASYDEQLPRVGKVAVGILGKLTLLTASVLGGADTPSKAEKFWLLDVDPTCIPSNTAGIVNSGVQKRCLSKALGDFQVTRLCLNEQPANQSDFTSHIEPDWDYDVHTLLVAYRHHGRIVHRLSPLATDLLVLRSWVPPVDDVDRLDVLEQAFPVRLEYFYGGTVIYDIEVGNVLLVDPPRRPRVGGPHWLTAKS